MNEEEKEQLEELQNTVKNLQNELEIVKEKTDSSFLVDRYIDVESKDIISNIIEDRIFDINWQDSTDFFTNFEGGTRLDAEPTAFYTIGVDGLSVSAGEVWLNSPSDYYFLITKEYNLKTHITFQETSGSFESFFSFMENTSLDSFGVIIKNGEVKIFSSKNFVYTEKVIKTDFTTSVTLDLEIQYKPNQKADFYIEGELVGAITTNLPATNIDKQIKKIVRIISKTISGAGTSTISFLEISQKKKTS